MTTLGIMAGALALVTAYATDKQLKRLENTAAALIFIVALLMAAQLVAALIRLAVR